MRKKRLIACVLGLLFTAVMFTGCRNGDEPQDDTSSTETSPRFQIQGADTSDTTEEEPTEGETLRPTDQEYIVVSTPYGDLWYQDQWADFMQTELVTEGDTVSVIFETVIHDEVYTLFTVEIGGDGEIGQLTDDTGTKRNVQVYMEELIVPASLTESERNRLYAMQEEINYVIEHLQ